MSRHSRVRSNSRTWYEKEGWVGFVKVESMYRIFGFVSRPRAKAGHYDYRDPDAPQPTVEIVQVDRESPNPKKDIPYKDWPFDWHDEREILDQLNQNVDGIEEHDE